MGRLIRFAIGVIALIVLGALAGAALARTRLEVSGGPSSAGQEDDEIDLVAIFDGRELESRAQAFRGGTLTAWFGGATLDLRNARLDPRGARLTVYALFGGVQVLVPDDVEVDRRVVAVLGGATDDRGGGQPEPGAGPTLRVDGGAAFGGVSITSEPRGPSPG